MFMISIVIVVDSSVSMETIQNVTTQASEICRVILNSSRGCEASKMSVPRDVALLDDFRSDTRISDSNEMPCSYRLVVIYANKNSKGLY